METWIEATISSMAIGAKFVENEKQTFEPVWRLMGIPDGKSLESYFDEIPLSTSITPIKCWSGCKNTSMMWTLVI